MLSTFRHPDLYGETFSPFMYFSVLETLGKAFQDGTSYDVLQFENEIKRLEEILVEGP